MVTLLYFHSLTTGRYPDLPHVVTGWQYQILPLYNMPIRNYHLKDFCVTDYLYRSSMSNTIQPHHVRELCSNLVLKAVDVANKMSGT